MDFARLAFDLRSPQASMTELVPRCNVSTKFSNSPTLTHPLRIVSLTTARFLSEEIGLKDALSIVYLRMSHRSSKGNEDK
jgi:hypothetical protein